MIGVEIRVRGLVQGVGFRPTVWKLARELGITGEVLNDGEGVLIRAGGSETVLAAFLSRLDREPPPLARVEAVETRAYAGELAAEFRIAASAAGVVQTQIAPDATICAACADEIADPLGRRYRYPFTTCTHCGPRLTIVTGVPYDRAATTMAGFPLCAPCAAEYADPADRRFHAEATACPVCGPRARLVRYDGRAITAFQHHLVRDDVEAVQELLASGELVAIKGLGGYHLACDATRAEAVARLRAAKHRDTKPFALMARSLDVIRRYCAVDEAEAAALTSRAGPIVLLAATGAERLPDAVAPGLATLGFMLPTTPLHRLILDAFDRPLVMTSGNHSEEPPAIDDEDAARRLASIAPFALVHDRPIANRVDDSVVRVVDGAVRVMRRARGYAPSPIRLPPGFEHAPAVLAYGGDLKAAFCLVARGEAILSQHQGDLEDPATCDDFEQNLALYAMMFEHVPAAIAVDLHPGFYSNRLARAHAARAGLPLAGVQHHHAHVAACLAETGRPLDAPPVLGIVLDGLGLGDDGTIWGGEFLLCDYRRAERLGAFKPVAMLGGDRASREPWRNLYAHLVAGLGWPAFVASFAELPVHAALTARPRAVLDHMLAGGLNAVLASSCGRLFDAVAAAVGICFDAQSYEGEAATRLEAAVDLRALDEGDALAYPFAIVRPRDASLPYLEPRPMWKALLADLASGTPVGTMAARFHLGLAGAIAQMVFGLARSGGRPRFDTIALSGGCFQNRILFEQCARRLRTEGYAVLSHARVPTNDGGLALGQAAVCAARSLDGATSCA